MLIALCGSEEKYNAFELKIRRLYEQAMMEFQRDYVALQQQPEKLTPLIQGIVEKYSGLVSGMDSLSEISDLNGVSILLTRKLSLSLKANRFTDSAAAGAGHARSERIR